MREERRPDTEAILEEQSLEPRYLGDSGSYYSGGACIVEHVSEAICFAIRTNGALDGQREVVQLDPDASLAYDFSINCFWHFEELVYWHRLISIVFLQR